MNSGITIVSFSIFLAIFLWVGAIASQSADNTEEDYLLGNRSFGRFFVGLSAGATGYSGWIMVGVVGAAYTVGISALLMPIAFFFGELTFWTFFPDKINSMSLQYNSQTIPEFLGSGIRHRRGRRIITLIAAVITIIFIGAYTSAQFAAAAKTLNVFFGVDQNLGAIIAALCILVYCVTGGLRASIWTDVVQAFVVLFVCFGMLLTITIAGGGVSEIVSQLNTIDPQLLDMTAGYTPLTLLTFIVGFFFFGFGFDISQPQILVRLMAGSSPTEVKKARWVYLAYGYSTWITMVFFGVACRVLIPSISDPEQALPFYAMENFPPFLIGIVLAGVFSVIASTADSQILVCSSALARDISPSFHREMSQKYGVKYEQFMTLLVGILAVIATLFLSSTVFSLILIASAAVAGSIGPAMLIILLRWRTNYIALSSTMIAGLSTCIMWIYLGWSSTVSEVFPGFVVALLVHTVFMRIVFTKFVTVDR